MQIKYTDCPVDASAVFDSWLEYENHSNEHDRGGFYKEGGAESYRRIWLRWLKHLGARNTTWKTADANDLLEFVRSGFSHTRIEGQPSSISQRRYFTVLRRIYNFATTMGWRDSNPADAVAEGEQPEKENHTGAVMNIRQWNACLRHLETIKPTTIIGQRDLAILRLLFDHALAPREIRELQAGFVKISKTSSIGMVQIEPIRSTHQARTIQTSAASTYALAQWLEVRKHLRSSLSTNFEGDDFCFISQKSPQLTNLALLAICTRHIRQACERFSTQAPVRLGPQIIRNSCIVRWLDDGRDVLHVCSEIGIKNVHGLKHITWALSDIARNRINSLA